MQPYLHSDVTVGGSEVCYTYDGAKFFHKEPFQRENYFGWRSGSGVFQPFYFQQSLSLNYKAQVCTTLSSVTSSNTFNVFLKHVP